jgi:hypothetical protein
VGSETGGWTKHDHPSWLPQGPKINSKQARKNVKKLLEIAAQYPISVQLVVGFTERDNHKATRRWARSMAKITKPYRNVFLSAMNEPYMSNWSDDELIELINILKESGRPVGVDQPAGPGTWRYHTGLPYYQKANNAPVLGASFQFSKRLASHCDYLDMHPPRNPEPNKKELDNIVRLNGWVFFSETTCYLSNENAKRWPNLRNNSLFYCNGAKREKAQQKVAKAYMRRVERANKILWSWHSIDCIKCDTLDFYLPKWKW